LRPTAILKTPPALAYPPEEGCYLRGNDYSPVAVVVILRWVREDTPREIEGLVRTAVESGAALAGTLQTENIGIEKIVLNVVANPNIRYVIVFGPESPGHLAGGALLALARNGLDDRKRIIGSESLTPYLFNIEREHVERFRKQITMIDLLNEGAPEVLRQAVVACYQETPTPFRDYVLQDPGAWPEPPLDARITWRVNRPELEPKSEEDRSARQRLTALMGRIRESVARKKQRP
jgi:tetrahydromethanopterin S-methyltransferase subunit A